MRVKILPERRRSGMPPWAIFVIFVLLVEMIWMHVRVTDIEARMLSMMQLQSDVHKDLDWMRKWIQTGSVK